jgi:putative ABC transport system permease protein
MLWHRQDVRDGVRTLRRQPAFVLSVVVTFALAIGTTTAIFAALDAVILTPLPFGDPAALVVAWGQDPGRAQPVREVAHAQFREWQVRARAFSRLAVMSSANSSLTWTRADGERRKLVSAAVSHEFFDVLGARPSLGRSFLLDEDRIDAPPAVILSDAFWAREYARDTSVVGRAITLDDRPVTIVGVMPRGFALPYGADVWTPVAPAIGPQFIDNPSWGVLYLVGRLRPGVDAARAQQELGPLFQEFERRHGLPGSDTLAGTVMPLTTFVLGNTRPVLLALCGTGAVVVIIACANIIGLFLVRVLARQRDSAVRVALGASRGRIVALWLTESGILAAAGLFFGLMLAWWGAHALAALAPVSTPQLDRITLTWNGLMFATVVSLAGACVCGTVPGWLASRRAMDASLSDGARAGETASQRRGRHALVVGQLALALMLLVGAGLMIRSVLVLRSLDLGYLPSRVLTVDVAAYSEADVLAAKTPPPAPADGSLEARRRAFLERARRSEELMRPYRLAYDGMLARVRALPQVQAAGGTYQLPLIYGPIGMDASILLEGQALFPARDWMRNPTVNQMSVTEGYFEATGARLLAGRLFTSRDTAASAPVVVIGETAARRFFPGREPIGRQLIVAGAPRDADGNSRWQTVIGVVSDSRLRGIDDLRLDVYMPHQQTTQRANAIVIRTTTDPAELAPAVRAAILAADPGAVIGRVQTLEAIVDTAMAPWRFGMLLFTLLAAVAFTLALTGLFGVMAYSVAQRHHEIAVRLAVGAMPRQVQALILREGAMLIVAGLALGVLGAAAGGRALASVLFGITPADPMTFVAVIGFVTLATLAACYVAARRTARVDALRLLR